MLKINFTSGKKGSNPGGKIKICEDKLSGEYYLKFCYGTKLIGESTFSANHQPIYEALTFELVNFLGLSTPEYYVLCNENKSLQFSDWKNHLPHDPSGRPYYFVSKILNERPNADEGLLNKILETESPYLDIALVSDIIGKRQNYICTGDSKGNSKVVYLDLGCSFAYAKEGFLTLPYKAKIVSQREMHNLLRELRGFIIQNKTGELFSASHFIEKIPSFSLQVLNPNGKRKVSDFLNEEEIREIQGYLATNLLAKRKNFIKRGIMA